MTRFSTNLFSIIWFCILHPDLYHYQEQYIFVYDGLLEALMSGDTSIPCPELQERYEQLKEVDPETKKSKLQDQFDVSTTPHRYS